VASRLSYVVITPARNEAKYIEKTIASMIAQTALPMKWVIVSDGSTDDTDAIVQNYLPAHPWIELVRRDEADTRNFGGKVRAFNAGLERVKDLPYDIIGNVYADVSFEPDYFEYLLTRFDENTEHGVIGTPFVEERYDSVKDSFTDEKHVAGAIQMFRRACFEDIGGYTAIRGGGIDWTAVKTARFKGWKTQSFHGKTFFHHKPMSTGESNLLAGRFNYGYRDYYFGNHLLWEALRVGYQLTRRPYVLGGAMMLAGFLWGCLRRPERPIGRELVRFHRKEQMANLRAILKGKLKQ